MNQNLPVQRSDSFPPASSTQADKSFNLSDMGLRDILSTIFKHKLTILLAFVLFTGLSSLVLAYYVKYINKPLYEAKSLILVKPGWESQNIDLSLDRRQSGMNGSDLLATEVRILQSRELMEKVISTLKPEVIFPDLAGNMTPGLPAAEQRARTALYRLDKNLSAKPAGGNIIEVSFKGVTPSTSAQVVNQLVDYYIDKRGDYYRNPKAFLFLEQKTEEYKQKLSEAEAKLQVFQDKSQIISFDEHRSFLLTKQREIVDARRENENQIAQLQETNSELERQLPNIQKTSIAATEKMTDMDSRLFTLELQEKELLSKYKEDNRLITNIREQIQMTKDYISKHGPGSRLAPVDPAYQDIQKRISEYKAQQSALKIRQKGLDQQLEAVNAEINDFEPRESKYKQLFRDATDTEDKYKTYLAKLEEARIHDELDRQKMTSVSVLEPASAPLAPTNLPRPLGFYIAIVLFLGLGGSIGLAFVLDRMSPCMSTPAQAEKRLDLPVLGVIASK
jgi:uncharacterized protein involved in exopolysaccharide biosynthesis